MQKFQISFNFVKLLKNSSKHCFWERRTLRFHPDIETLQLHYTHSRRQKGEED